jgi:DNA-binding NarL/FixJ family response regulator
MQWTHCLFCKWAWGETALEDQIRVAIVSDHKLFREGLRLSLGQAESIEIVGEAVNWPQAIYVINNLNPDVVLLSINIPDMDSIEAIALIRQKNPKIKTLILGASNEEATIFNAMKAGAKGYISKDASVSDLIKAIQTIHQGELWVERKLMFKFFDKGGIADSKDEDRHGRGRIKHELTSREQEVLRLLTKGYTNKEIAQALFVSEKTVKSHLNNIFRKLNVTRRLQAILYAINHGVS